MNKPAVAPRLPRDRKWSKATVAEWRTLWESGVLTPATEAAALRLIRNIDDLALTVDPKERRMLSSVIRLERNDLVPKARGAAITKAERAAQFPTEEESNVRSRAWQDSLPDEVRADSRGACWTQTAWVRAFGPASRYPVEVYENGHAWESPDPQATYAALYA
jgi:hypothetical protein